MGSVKDFRQPAASSRRTNPKNHQGGGAMKRNKRFIAIATLVLVVLSYLPLATNVSPVKAQGDVNVYEHGTRALGPQGQKYVATGEYHISKNVGGSFPNYTYPNYAQNMRMYFAYVTAERDLNNLPVDLNHFSGSYDFIHDPTWINGVFGSYCSPQGMVDAEVGKTKMGGGACNTSSMVADVLAKVPGVIVDSFSDHYWAPIPEVDPKYQLQVGTGCGSANPQAQSGNDVRIVGAKGLTLHWMIEEDLIKLWVTRTGEGSSWFPQSSDVKIYSDPETKQPANASQPEIDWPVYLKRVLKIDVTGIDPVVKVLVVVIAICFFLMLFLLAQNRQLKMKAEQKELQPYYRIRWLAYIEMFVLAVWSLFGKSEVVGILLGLAVQVSVFLWISKIVARVAEYFLVNTQAIVPRLIRDMVCLLFVLSILFQTAGVAISTMLYLVNVQGAQAQIQEWIPEWKRPETTTVDPVKYTGPPVANVPDGMVIPAVWDPILQAVTEEGGTPTDALKLYYIQRSECARSDYSTCVSSVGAQGPFQFMPTTWPGYSEPGWSVWDLHDAARAAYRMTKGLHILDQTTMESFKTRFCGLDGNNVWNGGSLGSAAYDGCDQAEDIWNNYEAAMAKGFGAVVVTVPELPDLPVLPLQQPDTALCQDQNAPCGFALPGGPSLYVLGTSAVNGNGFHDGAWDWWDPSKMSSSENPIDVLSMLNGTVTEVGRYSNGGLGGGTTYIKISNGVWTQRIYHCDENYIGLGDPVKWGQTVCLMGNQGDSDWTHLHLRLDGPNGPVQDQTQWWPK